MNKTKRYARKSRQQEQFELILIVCEGEKTEIKYFEELKKLYKLSQVTIDSKSDSDPKSVVERAIEIIDDKKKKYDYVYCVIDVDRHANLKDAKTLVKQHSKSRKKTQIQLIISCPCFEYWILLHYQNTCKNYYLNQSSPCQEVMKELKDHLPKYEKGYQKFGEVINEKRLEEAIARAKQYQKQGEENSSYTEVYQVVEKMYEIKNKIESFRQSR